MDGGVGEDPPMHQVQFVDQPMAMSSQGRPPASFLFATPASAQRHLSIVEVVSACKHRVDPCKVPSSGFATSTTNKSSSDAPVCGSPEVFQALRPVLSAQHPLYPRACVLSCFSRVRLCDPMDCSSPGSSVHGILQASILEWVAMPSSREYS